MTSNTLPALERDAEFILELLLGAPADEAYVIGWIQEVASAINDEREWSLAETFDALEYLREHGLVYRHWRMATEYREGGFWWRRVA